MKADEQRPLWLCFLCPALSWVLCTGSFVRALFPGTLGTIIIPASLIGTAPRVAYCLWTGIPWRETARLTALQMLSNLLPLLLIGSLGKIESSGKLSPLYYTTALVCSLAATARLAWRTPGSAAELK